MWIWNLLREQGYIDLLTLVIGLFGGLTDVLDGAAARFLNGRNKFGALFDKGADKFFILTIAFSLYYYCSTGYFLIILAGMEVFLALIGGAFALIKKTRLEANQWGKAKMCTENVYRRSDLSVLGFLSYRRPQRSTFSEKRINH